MARKTTALDKELAREIRATPPEYLPNLLQIVKSFRDSVTLKPASESFRQGWREARAGDTRPIAELWEHLNGE